jgi:hypothetical protein
MLGASESQTIAIKELLNHEADFSIDFNGKTMWCGLYKLIEFEIPLRQAYEISRNAAIDAKSTTLDIWAKPMVKYSRGGESFLIGSYKMELVAINADTNFILEGRTTTTLREGAESRDESIRVFDEALDYDCCGLKWHSQHCG